MRIRDIVYLATSIVLIGNAPIFYDWVNWVDPRAVIQYSDYGEIPLLEYNIATLWDWSYYSICAMLSMIGWMLANNIKEKNERSAWRLFLMWICISYTISAYRTCIDGNFDGALWYVLQMTIAALLSVAIQVMQKPRRNRIGFIHYDGQALGV